MIPHITDRAGAIYYESDHNQTSVNAHLSTYMRLDWKALAGATESNYRHWEMNAAPPGAVRVCQDLSAHSCSAGQAGHFREQIRSKFR